ncbi:uncharacterized protein BYT42DRAFT_589535 [Radiomyces spectabilis]|uniref:uncharacterized protein n=1 Tax=Radiomyces spectabilis TaxID=64574 RepID=UPI00221FA765|nr:uncharacterized protein BYT42DRAFT_589535 [Radiomyces spectabilis]KAI8365322.1 hypothetical protein BYT42DRAFT_589535 [Radiomyces spectabilis]
MRRLSVNAMTYIYIRLHKKATKRNHATLIWFVMLLAFASSGFVSNATGTLHIGHFSSFAYSKSLRSVTEISILSKANGLLTFFHMVGGRLAQRVYWGKKESWRFVVGTNKDIELLDRCREERVTSASVHLSSNGYQR